MKKYIIIPIVLFFLSIIFFVISFLVWLTKGKNSKLIEKKLKIGAIILTLTATISSISISCIPQTITCYVDTGSPPPTLIVFDDLSSDGIQDRKIYMDLTTDNILEGKINYAGTYDYSYRFEDKNKKVLQFDDLSLDDNKKFSITIQQDLTPDSYNLFFYKVKKENQLEDNYFKKYEIIVIVK